MKKLLYMLIIGIIGFQSADMQGMSALKLANKKKYLTFAAPLVGGILTDVGLNVYKKKISEIPSDLAILIPLSLVIGMVSHKSFSTSTYLKGCKKLRQAYKNNSNFESFLVEEGPRLSKAECMASLELQFAAYKFYQKAWLEERSWKYQGIDDFGNLTKDIRTVQADIKRMTKLLLETTNVTETK